MSVDLFYKAQTLLKRGNVELIEAKKGNLHFVVRSLATGESHDIFRTSSKIWSCNAIGIKVVKSGRGPHRTKLRRFGCVFMNRHDRDCSHTLACKLYLRQYSKDNKRKI